MIERAYVHVLDPHRPGVEARALLEALPGRGIDVELFTAKRMRRRQLALTPQTLVAGGLDMLAAAFKILGLDEDGRLPTYPKSLRELMGRRTWESTVGAVMTREDGVATFVKPRDRDKRFTGFIYQGRSDAMYFGGASGQLAVYCSEVVEFVAEFRAYIVDDEVRGVCHYDGSTDEEPPSVLLRSAIDRLRRAGESVAGYSIDVGRLVDDRWVIVECNEGFGLGLYEGLASEDYADLVCARWEELVRGLDSEGNDSPRE